MGAKYREAIGAESGFELDAGRAPPEPDRVRRLKPEVGELAQTSGTASKTQSEHPGQKMRLARRRAIIPIQAPINGGDVIIVGSNELEAKSTRDEPRCGPQSWPVAENR